MPNPEQFEQSGLLYNQEAPIKGILMPKQAALERYGINGDILATLTLPSMIPDTPGKQIGIIDFGNFQEGQEPYVIYKPGNVAVEVQSKARSRYGLMALNYVPRSHMFTYTALKEGESKIGRREEGLGYQLGLVDGESNVDNISRDHMTIKLDKGKLTVMDHSLNGTYLETAPEPDDNRAEITKKLGITSLQGLEVNNDSSQEQAKQKRLQLLFAPIQKPEQKPHEEFNFDHLVKGVDMGYSIEDAAVRGPSAFAREVVTPESEQEANEWIRMATEADVNLRGIIFEYPPIRDRKLEFEQISELIRMDADLRMQIGTYLLDKLHKGVVDLPARVRRGAQKNPDTLGYKHITEMSSEEYASLLALSFLDGTFKAEQAQPESYDPHTGKGEGQHRYAARQLLSTYNY